MRSERRLALKSAIEDLRRYRATFDLPRFLGDRDAQRAAFEAWLLATDGEPSE